MAYIYFSHDKTTNKMLGVHVHRRHELYYLAKGKTKYLIEAETYGNGIKMWLLSQGAWVKVLAPADFVSEIKVEIEKMKQLYT